MDWRSETPLIKTHGRLENWHAHVTKAHWLGDTCAFALGDGTVVFAGFQREQNRMAVHDGPCLAASGTGQNLITCGDDGRVMEVEPDGTTIMHHDEPGRFFDQLTTASWGGLAFADGRKLFVHMPDGRKRRYQVEAGVCGLAFSTKGRKLAVSRNNGASVYWVGTERNAPDTYEWNGAHGAIDWSPSARFIVTAMHENALHVWKTSGLKHGRMGGYPTRIKSFSWDAKGKSLATAGAHAIILWPFNTKDGPIGQSAIEVDVDQDAVIEAVACHPLSDIIAVGTSKTDVLLVRRSDGAIMPVARDIGSSITTLAWSNNGNALAFGTETGPAGLLDLSGA